MIEYKKILKNKFFKTDNSILLIDSDNILYKYYIETNESIKILENVLDFDIENDEKLIKIIYTNGKIGSILYDKLFDVQKSNYITDNEVLHNFDKYEDKKFISEVKSVDDSILKKIDIPDTLLENKFYHIKAEHPDKKHYLKPSDMRETNPISNTTYGYINTNDNGVVLGINNINGNINNHYYLNNLNGIFNIKCKVKTKNISSINNLYIYITNNLISYIGNIIINANDNIEYISEIEFKGVNTNTIDRFLYMNAGSSSNGYIELYDIEYIAAVYDKEDFRESSFCSKPSSMRTLSIKKQCTSISFDYKIDIENCGKVLLYIDNILIDSYKNTEWTKINIENLSNNEHKIVWVLFSTNLECCAYIDEIKYIDKNNIEQNTSDEDFTNEIFSLSTSPSISKSSFLKPNNYYYAYALRLDYSNSIYEFKFPNLNALCDVTINITCRNVKELIIVLGTSSVRNSQYYCNDDQYYSFSFKFKNILLNSDYKFLYRKSIDYWNLYTCKMYVDVRIASSVEYIDKIFYNKEGFNLISMEKKCTNFSYTYNIDNIDNIHGEALLFVDGSLKMSHDYNTYGGYSKKITEISNLSDEIHNITWIIDNKNPSEFLSLKDEFFDDANYEFLNDKYESMELQISDKNSNYSKFAKNNNSLNSLYNFSGNTTLELKKNEKLKIAYTKQISEILLKIKKIEIKENQSIYLKENNKILNENESFTFYPNSETGRIFEEIYKSQDNSISFSAMTNNISFEYLLNHINSNFKLFIDDILYIDTNNVNESYLKFNKNLSSSVHNFKFIFNKNISYTGYMEVKNILINELLNHNFGLGINPNFDIDNVAEINTDDIKLKYIESYYGVNKTEENRNVSDNISIISDNKRKKLNNISAFRNDKSDIFGINKHKENKDILTDIDKSLDDLENQKIYSVDLEIYPFISKNININANIKEINSDNETSIKTEIE